MSEPIRVAYSGGRDSTALAIYLKEQGRSIELVMADTGAELPETYWFAPHAARVLGVKLVVVSNKTFFQQVAAYGYLLPSVRVRWCTKELKKQPLDRYDKEMALGIRADEPNRMPSAYRPLVDAGIGEREVAELVAQYDLLNPAYKWRSSVSCFCCPFQRPWDWRNLWREHPALYAVAERWEELSIENSHGFTWNERFTLKQVRESSEDQVSLFPECAERACVICET